MDPTFDPILKWLGRAYLQTEKPAEAAEVFAQERANSAGRLTAFRGVAQARAGDSMGAERTLAQLRDTARSDYVSAYDFAVLEAALGRRDRALAELERAVDERSTWLTWIRTDPMLDDLRPEPAFARALSRVTAGMA